MSDQEFVQDPDPELERLLAEEVAIEADEATYRQQAGEVIDLILHRDVDGVALLSVVASLLRTSETRFAIIEAVSNVVIADTETVVNYLKENT